MQLKPNRFTSVRPCPPQRKETKNNPLQFRMCPIVVMLCARIPKPTNPKTHRIYSVCNLNTVFRSSIYLSHPPVPSFVRRCPFIRPAIPFVLCVHFQMIYILEPPKTHSTKQMRVEWTILYIYTTICTSICNVIHLSWRSTATHTHANACIKSEWKEKKAFGSLCVSVCVCFSSISLSISLILSNC